MAEDTRENNGEPVDTPQSDVKIEEGMSDTDTKEPLVREPHSELSSPLEDVQLSPVDTPASSKSGSRSPVKKESGSQSPKSESELHEETVGGDVRVLLEPGKPPKLSRKASEKVIARPARLFDHLPDATEEATQLFQIIKDCIYGSKYMGYSEHDSLDCDCTEDWRDGKNHACGEDSDCINRATKMECVDGDCNCGSGCQNQRFQRKQYANVSVIRTEKKGYGLRVNTDLQPNDFIFEYVGEVINEPTFRRRTIQYDDEGIKHFYFMSLTKSEFVDATKKGNLARFCNHSCNPNCYVDKWVVGEKLRMGIFAERHIKAGEELVFNYNVDRYGADPQPCYCGEPNCSGYIGGKTQTERATKLSHATIEALGIEDGDGWDTAVAKRPRKKKMGEDDEEYVNHLQPKELEEDGVRKVMATLMQCKEKWIAVKLLNRIQRADDDRVRNRVVQMHGYQILRTTLTTWKEDNNVVLQVLDILYKFPRLTRNKIIDSKIEPTVEELQKSDNEKVSSQATRLIEEWSKLEVAYRIPRKKFDPNTQPVNQFDRRGDVREEEAATKSPAPTPTIVAPTGPRNSIPQRNTNMYGPRPPIRRSFPPLPPGWFAAQDPAGHTYYYSRSGQTTWHRPHLPAVEPSTAPKLPPKSVQTQKALQDIIDSITKAEPSSQTPPPQKEQANDSAPKEKKEKWRSLPQEKQMKIYENTLSPTIRYVMQKFSHKLPKEDLKKFAKEVGKKLVASDFKNNRVEDPTKISEKQEKKVKKYVRDFFERAVEKKKAIDKRKAEKKARMDAKTKAKPDQNGEAKAGAVEDNAEKAEDAESPEPDEADAEVDLDEPDMLSAPATPAPDADDSSDLKRKRDQTDEGSPGYEVSSPSKRLKEENSLSASAAGTPPPPPPPPPAEGMPEMEGDILNSEIEGETEEEKELRLQEEALVRENEEAMMQDLKENAEAMKAQGRATGNELSNGDRKYKNEKEGDKSVQTNNESNGLNDINVLPSTGIAPTDMMEGVEDTEVQHEHEAKRKEVLSH
ncbi:hypothetical protein F5884DRAFT_183439 [Xylogone sp. PMI_703]|nr:hypothetical protein F5884DRAFT_183439 [Xylogone sp. PMI_703]